MVRVKTIRDTELEIKVWKENQEKFQDDIPFWHYAQAQIDKLQEKLDKLTRLEN